MIGNFIRLDSAAAFGLEVRDAYEIGIIEYRASLALPRLCHPIPKVEFSVIYRLIESAIAWVSCPMHLASQESLQLVVKKICRLLARKWLDRPQPACRFVKNIYGRRPNRRTLCKGFSSPIASKSGPHASKRAGVKSLFDFTPQTV